ncbi:hypothetical protein [Haloferula sp. A504]|uniref:hypothetical protein n=1 Tax=Haloferula sp. A504 TaxID=3373601 RepID=UPI0031BF9654|nr:hypothetical protein [Verrucomicrobiaceae bacterium E54]
MKWPILLLALLAPALANDRVTFAGDAYSLAFPQGWTKTKAPSADAEFARESPDKAVIISVNCDAVPEGASADLDATGKASAKSYAAAIQFKGEARLSDGALDGCDAKFLTLAPQNAEEGSIAMFAVFVDTKEHLVRIVSTMNPQLADETREACLAIVKSFRREEAESKDNG